MIEIRKKEVKIIWNSSVFAVCKRRAEIEDTCEIIKRIGHKMTFLNIRVSEMQREISLIDFILNEG